MLMESARLIRENKGRDWDKYLTAEDKQIIFGTVMPNSWYEIGVYERAGAAIFKEVAQGKLEMARIWGRFVIEDLGKRFYHNLVKLGDPAGAVGRCQTFIAQWFQFDEPDFQAIAVERLPGNQSRITIRYDHPYESFEPYIYELMGLFERIVELNGGAEARAEVVEKNYSSSKPYAVIMLRWH
jgi:hypothetical protein